MNERQARNMVELMALHENADGEDGYVPVELREPAYDIDFAMGRADGAYWLTAEVDEYAPDAVVDAMAEYGVEPDEVTVSGPETRAVINYEMDLETEEDARIADRGFASAALLALGYDNIHFERYASEFRDRFDTGEEDTGVTAFDPLEPASDYLLR